MNRHLLTTLVFLIPSLLFAQTKISGTISDHQGKPIPGANVFIKDSYDGASSDEYGKFSFMTDETSEKILSASFPGFENQDQKMMLEGKEITLKISLKEKMNEMNTSLFLPALLKPVMKRRW